MAALAASGVGVRSASAFVFSVLLAVLMSSCATSTDGRYPLQGVAEGSLFPWIEMSAVLEVEIGESHSDYLLALRSFDGDVDLVLLSPQGAPLYELGYRRGELEVRRKLATGDEPRAEVVLQVLQLMYVAPEKLQAVLAPGWIIQLGQGRRVFEHSESARELVVNYLGDPLGDTRTQLIDSGYDTILTVRILEQHNVLPE